MKLGENESESEYLASMEAILGNWGSASHIGGYPNWLQRGEIPEYQSKNFIFQLESGLCNGYVWRNDGIIYIHYI